jgi:hypothetical protein
LLARLPRIIEQFAGMAHALEKAGQHAQFASTAEFFSTLE